MEPAAQFAQCSDRSLHQIDLPRCLPVSEVLCLLVSSRRVET